jgi:ubiquinone/menaquinone biosynthesis C-methylase UbiE
MASMADLDAINRRTWKTRNVFQQYRCLEGYVDPGEQAATEYLADECRGTAVLDIGVGCGRTTPLLRTISSDYIGVDYTRELLEVAAQKHPLVRYQFMDARDMGVFGDASFYLVNFSYNAIDAVGYEDRLRILREVYRVLKPGGLFLFSAHNAAGPGARERLQTLLPPFSPNPLRMGWRLARFAAQLPAMVRNRGRYRRLRSEQEGYLVSNAAAHNFGLVLLYTSITEQKRQLTACGFRTEAVFESEQGHTVSDSDDLSQVRWLHYLARRL